MEPWVAVFLLALLAIIAWLDTDRRWKATLAQEWKRAAQAWRVNAEEWEATALAREAEASEAAARARNWEASADYYRERLAAFKGGGGGHEERASETDVQAEDNLLHLG